MIAINVMTLSDEEYAALVMTLFDNNRVAML